MLSCYKEWALRLIFDYNLGNLSLLKCLDNCVGKFMTAHQSIFHSTYKHTFCTPEHISECIETSILHTKAYFILHTNIHFAHQGIFHSTYKIHVAQQSIWHTTYKHSFLHTKKYNQVESSLEFTRHKQAPTFVTCTLYFILHVLQWFDMQDVQAMSATYAYSISHKQNLLYQALQCKMHTWGLHWHTALKCKFNNTKYGCHNALPYLCWVFHPTAICFLCF